MTSSANMGKPMILDTIGMTTDSGATGTEKEEAINQSIPGHVPRELINQGMCMISWRFPHLLGR